MANQQVDLKTSLGTVRIEVDEAKAPKSAANFLDYVRKGHYDGTVFHRVIPGFMIQGGGMIPGMKQKGTQAPIPNEADNGLKNVRYSLAMARTSDPHSATAQFFINLKRNAFLDAGDARANPGYAVFGKVVSGLETVDKIAQVPTGSKGMHQDVPLQPVTLDKATLEK